MIKRVEEITQVEIQKTNRPSLIVRAAGQVETGGWTDATLIRREYQQPPADGIWEYDLLAKPPDESAIFITVVTTLHGENEWHGYDNRVRGVRVYGEGEGICEQIFGQEGPGGSNPPTEFP